MAWWRDGYWSSTGTCFDIGTTTIGGLSRFERTGATTDADIDDESAANGSLMRLAAVPIRWHGDIADAAERSGESSRTTHAARRPVDACRLTGAMIAALVQGADADDVLGADFWQWGDLDPEILAIAGQLHDAAVGAPVEEPWPHDDTVHGWWVEPGAVLAGEYPGAKTAHGAEAKIDLLVDHGVRTFIDLTQPVDGLAPYVDHVERIGAQRGLDLHHRPFPIPDMSVRPGAGYDEIVDAIRASTDQGVVYVHCWGGIGRTSTVVGCFLVDSGLDADAALTDITRRRSVTRKAHESAPQTPSQIDVVHARAARRR